MKKREFLKEKAIIEMFCLTDIIERLLELNLHINDIHIVDRILSRFRQIELESDPESINDTAPMAIFISGDIGGGWEEYYYSESYYYLIGGPHSGHLCEVITEKIESDRILEIKCECGTKYDSRKNKWEGDESFKNYSFTSNLLDMIAGIYILWNNVKINYFNIFKKIAGEELNQFQL